MIPPKVSVILPTYNREKLVGAAIQSVLDQTFQDFELIVVDDGSTDRTSEVVQSFSSSKVRYIFQSNQGRSNARNHALSLAQGQYIAFLDSDDLYLRGKLELQVAYLDKHPEFGMIYTSAFCIDKDGALLNNVYEAIVSGWIYKEIAFFVPVTITLPTVMARREVFDTVGGFDEKMERFEDTDIWRRISKRYQIGALHERTCHLRTHPDNALAAQNPDRIAAALDYYVKKIAKEDCDAGFILRRKGMAALYIYYGLAMMNIPAWRKYAYTFLLKAIRFWPFNLIRVALSIASYFAYHTYKRAIRAAKTGVLLK